MKDYLQICREVKNDRDVYSIFNHGYGEMDELREELFKKKMGDEYGPDGVVGEATDVILCMLDIISKENPNMSFEELASEIFDKKIEKWRKLYGNL